MSSKTQQNAANAEESASASEEMNSQREHMRNFVGELVLLVGGNSNDIGEKRKDIKKPGF